MCVNSTYTTTYPKYHVVSTETWEQAAAFARTLTQTDVHMVAIRKGGKLWNVSWTTYYQSYSSTTSWDWTQPSYTIGGTTFQVKN